MTLALKIPFIDLGPFAEGRVRYRSRWAGLGLALVTIGERQWLRLVADPDHSRPLRYLNLADIDSYKLRWLPLVTDLPDRTFEPSFRRAPPPVLQEMLVATPTNSTTVALIADGRVVESETVPQNLLTILTSQEWVQQLVGDLVPTYDLLSPRLAEGQLHFRLHAPSDATVESVTASPDGGTLLVRTIPPGAGVQDLCYRSYPYAVAWTVRRAEVVWTGPAATIVTASLDWASMCRQLNSLAPPRDQAVIKLLGELLEERDNRAQRLLLASNLLSHYQPNPAAAVEYFSLSIVWQLFSDHPGPLLEEWFLNHALSYGQSAISATLAGAALAGRVDYVSRLHAALLPATYKTWKHSSRAVLQAQALDPAVTEFFAAHPFPGTSKPYL